MDQCDTTAFIIDEVKKIYFPIIQAIQEKQEESAKSIMSRIDNLLEDHLQDAELFGP